MPTEKVTVIIVNTNTGPFLQTCVRSLFENTPEVPLEVIMVDNASTDSSLVPIKAAFPRVKILYNDHNAGFAAACNRGIRHAQGRYILLLNPDTEVFPGAISKTLAFLRRTPPAGIVGCRLLDETGEPYSSYRTFPTAWDYLFDSLFLTKLFPGSKLFGRFYLTNRTFTKPTEVDVVQGSFFLFKLELLKDIGLLDERFFVYTEERDYCYRAKAAGWKVYFYPDAEVVHIGGTTTRQHAPEMLVYKIRSGILFHRKHDSRLKAELIKSILFLGILIRFLIWSLLSIFNRDPRVRTKRRINTAAIRWFFKPGEPHLNSVQPSESE